MSAVQFAVSPLLLVFVSSLAAQPTGTAGSRAAAAAGALGLEGQG